MGLSTFDAVAEPTRRRILDLLCDEERSVSDLVERLELSQPSVSKHLKVLRDARLVAARVSAQRRLYRLNPAPLLEVDAWLEPYRKFWASRLDALGAHLDEHARTSARAGKSSSPAGLSRAAPRAQRAAARPSTSRPSTSKRSTP
jgi:DNA-binding transcriptional ArsR family regulator